MNDEVLETAVCPDCGDDAVFIGTEVETDYHTGARFHFDTYKCPCGLVFDESETDEK